MNPNLLYLIFFIYFTKIKSSNIIKIYTKESLNKSYYIDISLSNDTSLTFPFKLQLNSLVTSMICPNISPNDLLEENDFNELPIISNNSILPCDDNLCYKLSFNNINCQKNIPCSFTNGIYVNQYLNPFIKANFTINNKLPIGCIINNNNSFYEKDSVGIFGLGGEYYSFLPHFYKDFNFAKNQYFFTLCLSHDEGYLTFGEQINSFHKSKQMPGNFYYEVENSNYTFKIGYLFFDYEVFNKAKYKSILDINSEFSYIKENIILNLFKIMQKFINKNKNFFKKYLIDFELKYFSNKGICFINKKNYNNLKNYLQNFLPPLYIGIGNKFFRWKSEYYLYKNENNYCIGLLPINENDEFIFGANFMYDHEFLFNFSSREILYIESNCNMKNENKKNFVFETIYTKLNKVLKFFIFVLLFLIVFLFYIVRRLRKRRSTLCIKFIGKEVTTNEINDFFMSNYDVIN